ncbi:unnamed protein product [Acanthoscelides obtectus]|uniref:Spondin-like TSP1 domain-containing protein n=1 Tax=Acanthoscelides obtectus TaxID=200917 RepID=A0A9P0PIK0_ACAOB|nr:unnamed protein product [Acanthoscelides obtectus]CAK1635188.1 Spondin-1 [Acanthoscelides obtectus]
MTSLTLLPFRKGLGEPRRSVSDVPDRALPGLVHRDRQLRPLRQRELARQHHHRGGPSRRRYRQRIHIHRPELADRTARRSVQNHRPLPRAPGRFLLLPLPEEATTHRHLPVKEYELSEVFHHAEDDHNYELMRADQQNTISVMNGNSDLETAIQEEREEQERHPNKPKPRPRGNLKAFTVSTPYSTTTRSKYITESERLENTINKSDASLSVTSPAIPAVVPRGDKDAIMNSIADSYLAHKEHIKRKKYRKNRKPYPKKIRPPRDCRVSEWSEWSMCSKSCGIGEMQRRREVVKHARRGGRMCPPLVETKWCGSARSCNKEYFSW